MKPKTPRLMHHAQTPRAAAIAGILFGVLFTACIVLMRLAMPPDLADLNAWTDTTRTTLSYSLLLVPLAGIAFLWFVGVVRDRLGSYEDQFFASVFHGSGLLFLALTFCAFAVGGGMLAAYQIGGDQIITVDIYAVGRSIASQLFNIYALKMAAVFMVSLSTLWLRTDVMPRWLCLASYAVALLMFLSLSLSLWMVLLFPLWVLCVSSYFLVMSYRRASQGSGGNAPSQPAMG